MMYRELKIRNFRCFRHLELSDLKRTNVFIGMNSVGKSSILEALFLLVGHHNPEITMRLSLFRGVERFDSAPEEIWGWLFSDRDISRQIILEARTDDNRTDQVSISLNEAFSDQLTLGTEESSDNGVLTGQSRRRLIVSATSGDASSPVISEAWLDGGAVQLRKCQSLFGDAAFLATARVRTKDDPERFSRLDSVGESHRLVELLRCIEPSLQRLSLQVLGGVPTLAADTGLGRTIPVAYLGEGIQRLVSLLLCIMTRKNEVVLVDEIENGLHHSVLKLVWRFIARLSRENDNQVFATTHSRECIIAAHEAFSEDQYYDFSLQRIDRLEGKTVSTVYEAESLSAAIEAELEVR